MSTRYIRNTDLDANSWQNKANAFLTGVGPVSTLPRPVVQWNNFGGTIGGPIVKDKLFFFADFMGTINNTPRTAQTNSVIPTPYLSGNFAQLCTSQGATFIGGVCSNPIYQLYQPSSSTNPSARQPYLNNQVPISSSVASKIVRHRSSRSNSCRATTPADTSTTGRAISKSTGIPASATPSLAVTRRCTQSTRAATAPTY